MKGIAVCAATLMTLTSFAACADTLPRITVQSFDSALPKSFNDMTAALPDIVNACFTKHDDVVEIIDRVELDALSEEATQNLALRHIHYKSAGYLLRGSIFPYKDGISINLMLYALGTGRLEASSAAAGAASDIRTVTCRAVDEMARRLPVKTEVADNGVAPAVAEKDRNMAEALGFYIGGAYERAIAAFLKILREDKTNAEAQYFLAKSYAGAGMDAAARVEFAKLIEKFPDNPHRAEADNFLAPPKGE